MSRYLRTRTAIQYPPIEKPQEEIIDDIKKQRDFQKNKYVEFLKKFIESECRYDYQRMTHVDDVRDKYNKFVDKHKNEISQYNVSYCLIPADIAKLDKRFEYKTILCCKHCKRKQFVGCCPEYVRDDRTKLAFLINFAC